MQLLPPNKTLRFKSDTAFLSPWSVFWILLSSFRSARDHELLYCKFMDIRAKIARKPRDEAAYQEWCVRRLLIESDELPIYRALDVSCHNEVAQARALSPLRRLTFWQQVTMHFFHFSGSIFPEQA